ncbi:hypothetical protein CapIbe_008633 [Capra ibex]
MRRRRRQSERYVLTLKQRGSLFFLLHSLEFGIQRSACVFSCTHSHTCKPDVVSLEGPQASRMVSLGTPPSPDFLGGIWQKHEGRLFTH